MLFDELKCGNFNAWESDGRDSFGPKGTWHISPLTGNNSMKIDGKEYDLYFVYGDNYVKWWTKGEIELSGEMFIESGTWFRIIVREILLEIGRITNTKIDGLETRMSASGGRTEEKPKPKKIMWFSRHEMSWSQKIALIPIYGFVEITQVDKMIENISEVQKEIDENDVLAVVAPLTLQQQFLTTGKPIIASRKAGRSDLFAHAGWYQIKKIVIETQDL